MMDVCTHINSVSRAPTANTSRIYTKRDGFYTKNLSGWFVQSFHDYVSKHDEFVLKTRNYVLKTRNFVLKTKDFAFKMMDFR